MLGKAGNAKEKAIAEVDIFQNCVVKISWNDESLGAFDLIYTRPDTGVVCCLVFVGQWVKVATPTLPCYACFEQGRTFLCLKLPRETIGHSQLAQHPA